MYEQAVATALELVATYGVVVLLLAFALEGAFVGKLIPTRALFVGTVLSLGTDTVGIASVFLATVVGATLGQLLVFGVVRWTDLSIAALPGSHGPTGGGRLHGWFDRWGLPAVAVSNAMPLARGSLTVPAAMNDAGVVRFSSAAVVGTATYAGGLVAVAAGMDVLLALA
ncbi:MAG: DedA family protein [Haloferacaceae archaeon]